MILLDTTSLGLLRGTYISFFCYMMFQQFVLTSKHTCPNWSMCIISSGSTCIKEFFDLTLNLTTHAINLYLKSCNFFIM